MSLRTAPPPPGPRWAGPWAEVARFAPLALAALVLVWHAQQYDFVTDDAYISFVFARNLAEHGALVFNLGDPVEGYTNFLWTFGLGLLMVVGIPPELASRIAGVGFGLGVLAMSFRLAERLLGRGHPLAALPALLLASSSGFACWSSGGLETQLYTFLHHGRPRRLPGGRGRRRGRRPAADGDRPGAGGDDPARGPADRRAVRRRTGWRAT
jgi:arabinofuranosyltransferase